MDNTPYILIAEDNEDHYELICDALKAGGSTLANEWVRDGDELLLKLSEKPLPQLILLDLNLPRKDGREALRAIKRSVRLRRIPILILTTSRSSNDVRLAYDLGANAFLCKPVGFSALTELMTSLTDFWLTRVELPQHNENDLSVEEA